MGGEFYNKYFKRYYQRARAAANAAGESVGPCMQSPGPARAERQLQMWCV